MPIRISMLVAVSLLSACAAAPLIAVQAAVQLASIAMRDPSGQRVIHQPTMAEQAQAKCTENDAGPDTECVAYMTHMTGSYY
jgi:hypothetical protein